MAGVFQESVLTRKGIALLTKTQTGACTIALTKAMSGDGSYTPGEDISSRVALKSPKQTFPINTVTVWNPSTVLAKFVMTNKQASGNLQNGYYVKEVGLYATDPDEGEILYAIAIGVPDQWDYLPAYNDLLPSTITVDFMTEVSNAESVTIEAPNLMYLYDEGTGDKYSLGIKNKQLFCESDDGERFDPTIAPQISVRATAGKTIICSNGDTTMTATATGGKATFRIPYFGLWNVKEQGEGGAEADVFVNTAKIYGVRLSGACIIGVEWDYGNPSTALARLTPDSDPYGFVTETITEEPSPAVGTGAGSSPFDAYAPWSGMEEYNISGSTTIKRGETGFSRTGNDTMVYIPEFWFAVKDDPAGEGGKRRYYISDVETAGFQKHPGSGRYLGRYAAGGTGTPDAGSDLDYAAAVSKSGVDPFVNITLTDSRTIARAKGANWQLYDFSSYCAVILLYLVEFADWDSQTMIGSGICGSSGYSAGQAAGLTDSMVYHTGRAAGENEEACQIQYRHIEGVWGNVWQWVDGINFNERAAYVCTDPDDYAEDTLEGYTATGITLPTSGFITGMGMSENMPWAMIPDAIGGSETTFVPDRADASAGWRSLSVGGYWTTTRGGVGLLCFSGSIVASNTNDSRGFRLLYVP